MVSFVPASGHEPCEELQPKVASASTELGAGDLAFVRRLVQYSVYSAPRECSP
jgi:hypothetical protein